MPQYLGCHQKFLSILGECQPDNEQRRKLADFDPDHGIGSLKGSDELDTLKPRNKKFCETTNVFIFPTIYERVLIIWIKI